MFHSLDDTEEILIKNALAGSSGAYATWSPSGSGSGWALSNGNLTGTHPAFALIPAGSLILGRTYIINSVGTTDFTLAGAPSNTLGISFKTGSPWTSGADPTTGTGDVEVEGQSMSSTVGKSSGKWYWELHDDGGMQNVEIVASGTDIESYDAYHNPGPPPLGGFGYKFNGHFDSASWMATQISYGITFTGGITIGVALDLDNGTVAFSNNGAWQGNVPISSSFLLGKTWYAATGATYNTLASRTITANFGATSFAYTPPAGFSGLHS